MKIRAKRSNTKTHTKKSKSKKTTRQARLEPRTCAYRGGRSTAEPKNPGKQNTPKIFPGGMIVFHPRKNRLPQWKPRTGDTKKIPEGKIVRKCWKPLPSRKSAPFSGTDRASRPREGSFQAPLLAKFGSGARSFADYTLLPRGTAAVVLFLLLYVRTERKYPGIRAVIPGGSPEKTPRHIRGTQKWAYTNGETR